MSALADQSTMDPWPTWVWLLAMAAVAVTFMSMLWQVEKPRQRTAQAVTTRPRCWTHNCPHAGAVAVLKAHDNLPVWVCHGCADNGTVRGYWRRAA